MFVYKDNIARVVGVLNHKFMRKLNEKLQEDGLVISSEQFRLMTTLWENDGISQSEISKKIGRNRATTGKMLELLIAKGLIKRKEDANDRRIKVVCVTQKGKELDKAAKNTAHKVISIATKGISNEEVETTKKILRKMITNL